jgi:hypothetical protein
MEEGPGAGAPRSGGCCSRPVVAGMGRVVQCVGAGEEGVGEGGPMAFARPEGIVSFANYS